MDLRIATWLYPTRANGPGKRGALWFQGCRLKCAGCWNPEMFSVRSGSEISIEAMVGEISTWRVEGVTLTGGEPLDQAEALAPFLALLKEQVRLPKGILLLTGYELSHVKENFGNILGGVDMVLAGPYQEGTTLVQRKTLWIREGWKLSAADRKGLFEDTVEFHIDDEAIIATGFDDVVDEFVF